MEDIEDLVIKNRRSTSYNEEKIAEILRIPLILK